jgi:hypothetical protein
VQLGFIQSDETDQSKRNDRLLQSPDWRKWDGGKVGGFPVGLCVIILVF